MTPTHTVRALSLASVVAFVAAAGCGDGNALIDSPQSRFASTLTLLDAQGSPAQSFARGEPIELRLRVTNLTGETQTLTLPSPNPQDFVVTDPARREVWRWTHGKVFPAVLGSLRIGPHDSWTTSVLWDQTDAADRLVGPGDYRAQGLIPGDVPGTRSRFVAFTIR